MKKTNTNTNSLINALLSRNKPTKVEIDGIDQPIYLRKITIGEQSALYKKVQTEEDTILNNSAYSILYSVCDENGESMFTEADLPQIAQIDAGTVGELMDAIKKVNRFDEDEAELEKTHNRRKASVFI